MEDLCDGLVHVHTLVVCRFDFRISVDRRLVICFRMKFRMEDSLMMIPRRWKICVMCAASRITSWN